MVRNPLYPLNPFTEPFQILKIEVMKANDTPRLLWGVLGLALAAVAVLFAWQRLAPRPEPLPVLATVPDFSFIERDGESFGLEQLRGRVWIADFIFTNCAGTCPVMTTHMNALQSALEKEGFVDVKLVSFTVDPERDTPDVLRRFADGYGAVKDRWFFVTGPGREMQKLAKEGFMLAAAASGGNPDEDIIHSNRFVLVDAGGRIRKYYLGTEPDAAQQIIADLKQLLAEAHS
jgi:protein SCO1/2